MSCLSWRERAGGKLAGGEKNGMICCFQSDLFDKQQQEPVGTWRLKGNAAVQKYTVQSTAKINIQVN